MSFPEDFLLTHLPDLMQPARFWVAYSGGMDSHVLLHATSALLHTHPHRIELKALHVNHGISPEADRWQAHCHSICSDLGIELDPHKVRVDCKPGESLETAARRERYRIFSESLETGDYLLQAHHLDDQMETLLFRWLRGCGPKGLAGIPESRELGQGRISRPLLGIRRSELQTYASNEHLQWVEDASNQNDAHDRNYLRRQVLPLLEKRWPGFRSGWQRSARLCAEAEGLQQILAAHDFDQVRSEHANRIHIAGLGQLDNSRQRNLLRYWIQELQRDRGIPSTDFHSLRRIVEEVLPAAEDAVPEVTWGQGSNLCVIRRFGGMLYLLRPFSFDIGTMAQEWNTQRSLHLGEELGTLSLQPVNENGFSLEQVRQLRVRFRSGGESVKPAGRKTRLLKKILQDYEVPPWLRDRIPLLYDGDQLLAVADIFIAEKYQQKQGNNLFRIHWQRSDIHCGY